MACALRCTRLFSLNLSDDFMFRQGHPITVSKDIRIVFYVTFEIHKIRST